MRTYRFKNRHGVEQNVAQELAVMLMRNPAMKFLGEVITETKVIDVPKTRTIVVEKYKYKEDEDGNRKRVPFEVEETEEYTEKEMKTVSKLDPESTPFSNTDDVSIGNGGQVRQRTVINRAGNQVKRSSLDKR